MQIIFFGAIAGGASFGQLGHLLFPLFQAGFGRFGAISVHAGGFGEV